MLDVARWLADQGLGHLAEAFAQNGIAADILRELTDADLKELGLNLGDRKRLLKAIGALDAGPTQDRVGAVERAASPAASREAERRQLTVMFVDLVGSTELSAGLDPEDMGTVIRAYQDCCAEVVKRWGGHVAKYMGDGVLVYFGYPQAHEDEAERAVRAGLTIIDALAKLKTRAGEPLAARVGVATGVVMVGELVGEGAAQEQAVIGETPNLAARLQALAEPGTVVIAASTRRLVGGLFELTDLGPQHLKGFAEALAAFRVEGEGDAEGRFEALRGERLTPLIGREHELAMLLERWTRAKEGDGQVVLISGEPGIGKSRLLRVLRQELRAKPHFALSHFCSPHHTNSALYPIITQLERATGFAPQDEPEAKLAKLEEMLGHTTTHLDETVPLLAALLSIPVGDRDPGLNLSPQRQKQRTLEVLVEQLEGLARARPVLELYEDVHCKRCGSDTCPRLA
jgi:class 3 adenylate cyclase